MGKLMKKVLFGGAVLAALSVAVLGTGFVVFASVMTAAGGLGFMAAPATALIAFAGSLAASSVAAGMVAGKMSPLLTKAFGWDDSDTPVLRATAPARGRKPSASSLASRNHLAKEFKVARHRGHRLHKKPRVAVRADAPKNT